MAVDHEALAADLEAVLERHLGPLDAFVLLAEYFDEDLDPAFHIACRREQAQSRTLGLVHFGRVWAENELRHFFDDD